MQRLLLFILAGCSSLCFATPTGYGWTPTTTPLYYAGTNCSVNYSARAGSSERLTSIKLYIGGELVNTVTQGNNLQIKTAIINTVFDSSHFTTPSNVETHIDVEWQKLIGGNWVTQTTAANLGSATIAVKNRTLFASTRALGFFHISPTVDLHLGKNGVVAARSQTGSMNYDDPEANAIVETTWTEQDFFAKTAGKGVVCVFSHGDGSDPIIMDSDSNSVDTDPNYLGTMSVLASIFLGQNFRQNNNGTGIPPQNSTAEPPMAMLCLFGCSQGNFISSWSNNSVYPANNNTAVDQCAIGFNYFVRPFDSQLFGDQFFAQLKLGKTVRLACDDLAADQVNATNKIMISETANGFVGANFRPLLKSDMSIDGDQYTKIHGVYTGDATVNTNWYRN
jgi:hypothetical protein